MKKSVLALAALCLALPCSGAAQGLPQFLDTVGAGLGEGLALGAAQAESMRAEDPVLSLSLSSPRLEAGGTVTLTVSAENPRTEDTYVAFTLNLPERLACNAETAWEAVLPAAKADESGVPVPSVTTFERTLALPDEGVSETAQITCEMSMGPRFYRAQQALDLCVPDVRVSARLEGANEGRLQPGDPFSWRIAVENAGAAAKAVGLMLVLPDGAAPEGEMPAGFTLSGSRLSGSVQALAAQPGGEATRAELVFPMRVSEDALENDSDKSRLMSGALYADEERIPLPRIQVCSAKVSAQLLTETERLAQGETTTLRVMVVNEGLAGAAVSLSCTLPEGLTLLDGKPQTESATPGEAPPADDGAAGPDSVPALAKAGETLPVMTREGQTVSFSWQMGPATETEAGLNANTQVIELPVRADAAQERLVGASIAYSVNGGDTQLGEAVAMRLSDAAFLGISSQDWCAVFWASVLMLVTVACLYGAVRAGSSRDDYCCE